MIEVPVKNIAPRRGSSPQGEEVPRLVDLAAKVISLTCAPHVLSCLFCIVSLPRGIIKSGKVVVLLQGRYAGRKAVIVKAHEDGTTDRKFSHAIGER